MNQSNSSASVSNFGWVVGPSIVCVHEVGSVSILEHEGGDAFSIIWRNTYFGCCPTLKHALRAAADYNGRA